jgi:large subunit ribosomal protein L18
MATGPRYSVPMRRRREGRTDYHQRLRLLKSGDPRLAARTSNSHVRAQLITPGPNGDITHVSATSEELDDYGWEAQRVTFPARI